MLFSIYTRPNARSRKGGESVFRIAIGPTGRIKIDIVNFGKIPKRGP